MRPINQLVAAGALAATLLTGCSGSPCDQMRAAQDDLADIEAAVEDSGRNPEQAPSKDEIMDAYDVVADKTQACTDSLSGAKK